MAIKTNTAPPVRRPAGLQTRVCVSVRGCRADEDQKKAVMHVYIQVFYITYSFVQHLIYLHLILGLLCT